MRKLHIMIGIVSLCAIPALAQAQSSAEPTFKEKMTNPLRNTPAGREPMQDPKNAITLGSADTQLCVKQFDEATLTVANWQPGARKTAAEKELEGARTAIRGNDARTCRMHVQAALKDK